MLPSWTRISTPRTRIQRGWGAAAHQEARPLPQPLQAINVALGPKGPSAAYHNRNVSMSSLSLGSDPLSEAIESALKTSVHKGKLVLAAASNKGTRCGLSYLV